MNTINGRIQTKKKNITMIASMAEALTADMEAAAVEVKELVEDIEEEIWEEEVR